MATCWYSLRIVGRAYQKTCVNAFGSLSLLQNKEARVWDWRLLGSACRRRGEPPGWRHALTAPARDLNYACHCPCGIPTGRDRILPVDQKHDSSAKGASINSSLRNEQR